MKRKNRGPNPAKDIESFKTELLRLQKSEVDHLVDHYNFTSDELVDAMWDPTIVKLLREVAQYASYGFHTEDFAFGDYRFRLHTTEGTCIIPPRFGLLRFDNARLAAFLTELGQIVGRWQQAQDIITLLFTSYPMSGVRYLLPQLQSIVPPGHVLRTVKPVPGGVLDFAHMTVLREVVATLARGLLSNPDRPRKERGIVAFNVFTGPWSTTQNFWVA